MRKSIIILVSFAFAFNVLFVLMVLGPAFSEPSMAEYTCYPIFQINAVEPNVLIILDNSGSMNNKAYSGDYDHSITYYGYFEPYKKYSYSSNLFIRDASGSWDGNFLNWMCMRRVDVARRVLVGGKCLSRTGGGASQVEGSTSSGYPFIKTYDDTTSVTPFSSGTTKTYTIEDSYFKVDGVNYTIKVQKDSSYADEASNFVDGNIAGVLQKVGSRARWGNEWFNEGTGNFGSGGTVVSTVGTNMTSLVTDIQNTVCNTWTPLAESYYVAMQYFKQQAADVSLDYPNGAAPCANLSDDPYYNGSEFVECADAFVILLTDGASTMDMMIPASYKNYSDSYDTFVTTGAVYTSSGSDYLKDIAL